MFWNLSYIFAITRIIAYLYKNKKYNLLNTNIEHTLKFCSNIIYKAISYIFNIIFGGKLIQ